MSRLLLLATLVAQIVAGSAEDKAFQQLTSEANPDAKLQKLVDFEKSFPRSRALPSVTAMMVLSRNYAIKRINLDRAVELAQKAVDQVGKMRSTPPPTTHTDAQWKSYLDSTEAAARNILSYTMSIRGR
jgi:hypothetical protein